MKVDKECLSVEYIRECLREENGRIFWLERPLSHFSCKAKWQMTNTRFAGKEAGCCRKTRDGYQRCAVRIMGITVFRSRAVWVLHHGEWPSRVIDHHNRNTLDDCIDNLRLATGQQNQANRKKSKSNKSGYKGVSWDAARGKWVAQIRLGARNKFLGNFTDPREAHQAYCKAATQAFGEFACFN